VNEVGAPRRCGRCNEENDPRAGYCSRCGEALSGAAATWAGGPFVPLASSQTGQGYTRLQPPTGPYDRQDGVAAPLVPWQPAPLAGQPGGGYAPCAPVPYPAAPYSYPAAPYGGLSRGYAEPASAGYAMQGMHGALISVQVNPVINVQMPQTPMAPPPQAVVVLQGTVGPPLLVRALWFLFIGLWLGTLATAVGWVLCILVLPLPAGVMILNRLPAIMTLRPASRSPMVSYANGVTLIQTGMASPQLPLVTRAAYFLLIGWWASALVLAVAWCLVALSVLTLGLSLAPAFLLFERVPQVLTLRND